MSEFDINTDVINGAAEGFGGDYRDLNNLNFQILCVRCRLFGASMIPIRLHLARLDSLGLDYTAPLSDGRPLPLTRLLLRLPKRADKFRDPALRTPDRRRQA